MSFVKRYDNSTVSVSSRWNSLSNTRMAWGKEIFDLIISGNNNACSRLSDSQKAAVIDRFRKPLATAFPDSYNVPTLEHICETASFLFSVGSGIRYIIFISHGSTRWQFGPSCCSVYFLFHICIPYFMYLLFNIFHSIRLPTTYIATLYPTSRVSVNNTVVSDAWPDYLCRFRNNTCTCTHVYVHVGHTYYAVSLG